MGSFLASLGLLFLPTEPKRSAAAVSPTCCHVQHDFPLYLYIKNDMKPLPTEGYTGLYFTTATIKGWKHLFKPDKYKLIVTDAMTFLAEREEVWFYALLHFY